MTLEVQVAKRLPSFSLDVAFQAQAGSPLAILGPSGSGKTMLLRCIAGLERPDRGRVVLRDRVLLDSERAIQTPARSREVGLLFQHYALFPHKTVLENLVFGIRHLPPSDRRGRLDSVVSRTHIAGLERRYPRELSGGEQQRVALARALATEPQALLLDEPLSALDTHLRSQVEAQLQQTFAEYSRPTLLVTHNIEEAYRLCDQLIVLSRGRIAAQGPKDEVFRRPPTAEVARLTGCKNLSRAKAISQNEMEALDWGCRLTVTQHIGPPPAFVGIRAHHIDFVDSSAPLSPAQNVVPCWLVRSSETPFRITLFLRLHESPVAGAADFHLQAEVFKEKWERFRQRPFPWHIRISPDTLFLTPE